MIALDTSVVIRYLTDDPPDLARRARSMLDTPAHFGLSVVVLLEAGHVLRTQYGVTRLDVLEVLVEFVTRENVVMLGLPKETTVTVLARARELPEAPFADALVVAMARESGAEALASFDQGIKLHGLPVIEP